MISTTPAETRQSSLRSGPYLLAANAVAAAACIWRSLELPNSHSIDWLAIAIILFEILFKALAEKLARKPAPAIPGKA